MPGGAAKGAAALTAAPSAGALRGWHGDKGVALWGTCLRGIGQPYRLQRHSQLLNEGVEVLGSLPAVLEETGRLLRVIEMQMGEDGGKKEGFRENVAGDDGDSLPGKLRLLCGSLAVGVWREPSKGQAQPMGFEYPNYLGCLGCRIGLLFSSLGSRAAKSHIMGGPWVTVPVKNMLLTTVTVSACLSFPS